MPTTPINPVEKHLAAQAEQRAGEDAAQLLANAVENNLDHTGMTASARRLGADRSAGMVATLAETVVALSAEIAVANVLADPTNAPAWLTAAAAEHGIDLGKPTQPAPGTVARSRALNRQAWANTQAAFQRGTRRKTAAAATP